jgi:hypothetical protein
VKGIKDKGIIDLIKRIKDRRRRRRRERKERRIKGKEPFP